MMVSAAILHSVSVVMMTMVWVLIMTHGNEAAPVIKSEDYRHASFLVNVVNCVLQFLEVVLVLTFALYNIRKRN